MPTFFRKLVARIADALGDRAPDLPAAQPAPHQTDNAEVRGPGTIATQGGVAAGAGGVAVAGDNTGVINTGVVNYYYAASDQRLTKEQIAQQVAGYLRWLQARTENIELRGIEWAG